MRKGDEDSTTTADDAPSALKLRSNKIRIEVMQGPDAGLVDEHPGPSVRIGNDKSCDFILSDRTVSRVHLRILIEKDAIRVIDEGSRNGTAIDGTRVRDAYARPDSRIRLGDTVICLRMLSDVVEVPISSNDQFGSLRGRSVAMRQIFGLLERVASSDVTVLIEGETGTGKELVAEGLHEASPRSGGPFIPFDCGAVSSSLIESELFGHTRGAFTGAVSERAGVFEEADGGTLFLDEIGELPAELQPKLLRAIESRTVRRLGSNKLQKFNVRIVAATNRSLAREVDRGRFREDLYYRLEVVRIHLPPLRERIEDIPILVRHFEEVLATRGGAATTLGDSVVRALCEQSWPGNVRELRNTVERIHTIGYVRALPGDLGPISTSLSVDIDVPLLEGRDHIIEAYEREYIQRALERTGGNISRAAEIARVGRKFFQLAMRRYGMR